MYKKILSIIVVVLACCSMLTAFKLNNKLIKSKEFTAKTKDSTTEFEQYILEDGIKYELPAKNVKYEILSKTPDKKVLETEVVLGDMITKNGTAEQEIEKDGLTYQLAEIVYTDTIVKNRTASPVVVVNYDLSTVQPTADETLPFDYTDTPTNKIIPATLQLKEVRPTDVPMWYEDVTIPIKLTLYDTSYYFFNDIVISANGDINEFNALKSEVLKSLNLDENLYKIDKFEWDGDEYIENGIVCRNVKAYGQRFAGHYEAEYGGIVALPDTAGYTAVAKYTTEIEDKENFIYTIKATATYKKERNKAVPYVAAGGIAIVGVFFGLFALSRKNVTVQLDSKVIYRTKVTNGVVILDKLYKYSPELANLKTLFMVVTIKSSYTSRHINESIKVTANGKVLQESVISGDKDLKLYL